MKKMVAGLLACLLLLAGVRTARAQEVPVWKVLWLVYPNVDIRYAQGDAEWHAQSKMSKKDRELAHVMRFRFENYIETNAQYQVDLQIDEHIMKTPLHEAEAMGGGLLGRAELHRARFGYHSASG